PRIRSAPVRPAPADRLGAPARSHLDRVAQRDPARVSAPTREEAVRAAGRLFEQELLVQLVDTLTAAGAEVPNWQPGIAWEDHIDALHAAVREHGLRV
ncbi:MAG: hypothetical protein ACKOSO_04445, partial [Actinomycetota bacterium]